jgi:hypothetical protein
MGSVLSGAIGGSECRYIIAAHNAEGGFRQVATFPNNDDSVQGVVENYNFNNSIHTVRLARTGGLYQIRMNQHPQKYMTASLEDDGFQRVRLYNLGDHDTTHNYEFRDRNAQRIELAEHNTEVLIFHLGIRRYISRTEDNVLTVVAEPTPLSFWDLEVVAHAPTAEEVFNLSLAVGTLGLSAVFALAKELERRNAARSN